MIHRHRLLARINALRAGPLTPGANDALSRLVLATDGASFIDEGDLANVIASLVGLGGPDYHEALGRVAVACGLDRWMLPELAPYLEVLLLEAGR